MFSVNLPRPSGIWTRLAGRPPTVALDRASGSKASPKRSTGRETGSVFIVTGATRFGRRVAGGVMGSVVAYELEEPLEEPPELFDGASVHCA